MVRVVWVVPVWRVRVMRVVRVVAVAAATVIPATIRGISAASANAVLGARATVVAVTVVGVTASMRSTQKADEKKCGHMDHHVNGSAQYLCKHAIAHGKRSAWP